MEGRINAIVTGGTCGLGKALVKTLLKNGCNVATFGRRPDLVRTLIEEVGNASLFAESCDLTNLEQVSSFLRKATIAFGAQDLIILNAGELGPTPLKSVKENSILYFRLVFETNFFSNVWLIKEVLGGRKSPIAIVHVTSDSASNAYAGWGAYSSSKIAMDHLLRIIQADERVNMVTAFSLDPGDMDTEMHRRALPEDNPDSLKKPEDAAGEVLAEIWKRCGFNVR